MAPLLGAVYERLVPSRPRPGQPQAAAGQTSSIIPIVRPNAVLIIASAAEMDAIRDLAEKLDQPVDPTTDFRVFRLEHAVATQVLATLGQMYDITGGPQAAASARARGRVVAKNPRRRRSADECRHRTSQPTGHAGSRPIHQRPGFRCIKGRQQAQNFPLKNAIADELAASIQLAIQNVLTPARVTTPQGQAGGQGQLQQGGGGGQGGGAAEVREVRSQILQFIGAEGSEDRAIRSGILADIRISSIPARTASS